MLFIGEGAVEMHDDQSDPRRLCSGYPIPSENYCDQPYVVKTSDGAWLCAITTGSGREGDPGQHVVTMRSTNLGKTWSNPVPVEPACHPESSYSVLLKNDDGRIYCFYNHNTDDLRHVIADDPPYVGGRCRRVDSLGYYVFRFSDDHGRSWSTERYAVPVREMEIDRQNPYQGKVRFFWNVGVPIVHAGNVYLPLHKVGGFGKGFFKRSEGVLLHSPNLMGERDPTKIRWETFPVGDVGLKAPPGGGPIAEEQSYCVLSDGGIHCIYRTIDGHPASSYSRDRGRTWATPEYATFGSGRRMKHPRAAVFAWRCGNGKYLCWFHNHGGRNYEHRNPAWVCGGEEYEAADGKRIRWSEPEVLLYDGDPGTRISYPDLVEDAGRYFITETQKHVGRVHEIPQWLLEAVWGQFDCCRAVTDHCILALSFGEAVPEVTRFPALSAFVPRGRRADADPDCGAVSCLSGFSIEMMIRSRNWKPNQVLLDTRGDDGKGIAVLLNECAAVELVMCDGRSESRWHGRPGLIRPGKLHHVVINVDLGPRIVSMVIDGEFDDGGSHRQFGWGWFSPWLGCINTAPYPRDLADPMLDVTGGFDHPSDNIARIGPQFDGQVHALWLYDRCLLTSEAVGNYRARVNAPSVVTRTPHVEVVEHALAKGCMSAEPARLRNPSTTRLPGE